MAEEKDNRFNGSIDEKNRQLLITLEKAGVQIEFEVNADKEVWGVRNGFKYIITAPNKDTNPTGLAHELLHILMDILGFVSTPVLVRVFTNRNCRFDTSALNEWENLLGHCKMIRHFRELGYDTTLFTERRENKFDTGELLPFLKLFGQQWKSLKANKILITPDLCRDFLGMLIVVKEFDLQYERIAKRTIDPALYYTELRNCDTDMFDALNNVLNAWIGEERNYSNVDFYNRINAALEKLGYLIADPY